MIDCFVYCGGKCGSLTLYHTLLNNGFQTIHSHDNNNWSQFNENTIFD